MMNDLKKSSENVPSEHAEQVSLVQWFERQYPQERIFAILEALRLKQEGVRSGVPDLMIPTPSGGFHGLFVEMKRSSGGTVAKEQKDWMSYLVLKGYKAEVCKGYKEARAVIEFYLSPTT